MLWQRVQLLHIYFDLYVQDGWVRTIKSQARGLAEEHHALKDLAHVLVVWSSHRFDKDKLKVLVCHASL